METYATAVLWAVPFFLGLIALEWVAARRLGRSVMRSADTLASLSSGTTNTVKTVLGLSVAIVSYDWMVERLAVVHVEATWAAVAITFLVKDFAGYWNHRLNHEVNFFWNRHVVHHSSEEYNLACALRQSISEVWVFFALFMLPAALVGVPTAVVAIVAPVHLFAQFWYHTRVIDKLPGWFEYVFVTPSHHRVHHAINDEYLDRNYSEVFIVWDRLFGTFQPELAEVPPVYGVKKAVGTYNPFVINYQHLWRLLRDAWYTESWRDRLRIWFMPTGWRPPDVAERFPIEGVLGGKTVYGQVKYDPEVSRAALGWAWAQFAWTQLLMVYLFTHLAEVGVRGGLLYGAYLGLTIWSLTALLDGSRSAIVAEVLRVAVTAVALWVYGGWFGAEAIVPAAGWVVLAWSLGGVLAIHQLAVTRSDRMASSTSSIAGSRRQGFRA